MTGTDPGRTVPRRPRLSAGGTIALVYVVICAALFIWALVVSANSDESMAGVIPLLATAPVSLVLLVLPDGTAMLVVAVALGALVNAAVITWCARALSRGRRAG
ncbi:hypothetical protein [Streptomyces sp. NPDC047043]|uniref:SCO4225 family membrane protein n=1 Tax=Streptomyces sp. NPDC047043 TaxID=3154497 RepID=UPI0033F93EF2